MMGVDRYRADGVTQGERVPYLHSVCVCMSTGGLKHGLSGLSEDMSIPLDRANE